MTADPSLIHIKLQGKGDAPPGPGARRPVAAPQSPPRPAPRRAALEDAKAQSRPARI